jgi:hypothetical protein
MEWAICFGFMAVVIFVLAHLYVWAHKPGNPGVSNTTGEPEYRDSGAYALPVRASAVVEEIEFEPCPATVRNDVPRGMP